MTTLLSDPLNSLDYWQDGRHLEARIRQETGNSLARVTIPQGEYFGTDLRFPVASSEATIKYRYRRSPNWHTAATWSGKMLGFADLRWDTGYGHKQPTSAGGGSWRGLFGHPSGNRWGTSGDRAGVYFYHLDQSQTYGDKLYFGDGSPPGQWSDYELTVRIGSDGRGEIEGQVNDGGLVGTVFRCAPGTQVDIAWWDVYHGGTQTPLEDIYLDFDDIEITVPGGGTQPPVPPSGGIVMPTLMKGDGWVDHKNDVRRLQAWLAIAGEVAANTFDSQHRPDGLFGSGTQQAVMSFQLANGLAASGVADAQTWGRLASWRR